VTAQLDIDQMSTRLRALTRDGGSIEAAQVKLIGLDEIREAAGARWPRMRERVRSGSMSILAQHLGPDDVIVPAGDGFLIMLAEARTGDTQRRCQDMRDALLKFYLGDEALVTLRPEVKNRVLSPAGLTDLITSSIRGGGALAAKNRDDEMGMAPVLVANEKRVGAILACPIIRNENVRRIAHNPDFILDGRHAGNQDFLELDLVTLDAALSRVTRLREGGRKGVVGVCVHATTMQTRRSREAYYQWLSEIDPELRSGLIVVINEIERGTPLLSMTEWCSGLRAYINRVSLNLHYGDHAIASIGATGAWAAGFHLPTFIGAQRGIRGQKLRGLIGFWAKSLHGQGMRLVVHGFQDVAFYEDAAAMGVDMLTSDTHWPFAPVREDALPQ
jgi:hypothetical protein